MSVAMQKRQPRNKIDSTGKKIGGQYASVDRPNDLMPDIDAVSFGKAYPTNKRQFTIKVPAHQTDARPASKAPVVRVKKDPNTGFWEAETPYCNPQSGYAMERLRGGLTGDESEIVGYYAQTAAALCNAGIVDVSEKIHLDLVRTGVSTAAACLGLQGGWSKVNKNTRSKRTNRLARLQSTHSFIPENKRMMLYFAALSNAKFFCWVNSYTSIASGYGPLSRLKEYQELHDGHTFADHQLRRQSDQAGYRDSSTENQMLIWAIAFQHSYQHFLHNLNQTEVPSLDEDIQCGNLVPDVVLAGAAYCAFKGEIGISQGERLAKLWAYWLDTSASDHTSHVFDSSLIGRCEYHEPENLAKRLDEDWVSRLFFSSPSYLGWTKSSEHTAAYAQIKLSEQESQEAIRGTNKIAFVKKIDAEETPADVLLQRTSRLGEERYENFMRPNERYFELIRDHATDCFAGSDYYSFPKEDKVTRHAVFPKLFLALHAMANLDSGTPARRSAELFIKETNTEPLVATLLALAIHHATKTETNYHNYHNGAPKYPEASLPHQRLVLNAAQAWHGFDHDSSAYALPGGRLDPEVMLKKAQQLQGQHP